MVLPDLPLAALMGAVTSVEEDVLEEVAASGGTAADTTIAFPAVTLILPERLISGNLVGFRTYLNQVRQVVEAAEGEGTTGELGRSFLRSVLDNLGNLPEEFDVEGLQTRQVYLINTQVLSEG